MFSRDSNRLHISVRICETSRKLNKKYTHTETKVHLLQLICTELSMSAVSLSSDYIQVTKRDTYTMWPIHNIVVDNMPLTPTVINTKE